MASPGSVTDWIDQVKQGDMEAASKVRERYFGFLVRVALKRLRGREPGWEEDVALDAWASFFRGAEAGKFPDLSGRDELRALLIALTHRKAMDLLKGRRARKRGHGLVRAESFCEDGGGGSGAGIEQVVDPHGGRDCGAVMERLLRQLLEDLPDDLRRIAGWRLVDGLTIEEIARRCGLSVRTVERRLKLIHDLWKQAIEG